MYPLRHASRPVGQLTKTLFRPSQSIRVPSLTSTTSQESLIQRQTRAFRRSPCYRVDSESQASSTEYVYIPNYLNTPEDTDHKIVDLPKPWRLSDLTRAERAAYAKYGPNYTQLVSAEERERYQRYAINARLESFYMRKRYGPQWHDTVHEAKLLRNDEMKASSPALLALQKKGYELRVRRRALLNQGMTYAKSAELREVKKDISELQKQEAELASFSRAKGVKFWVKRAERLRLEREKSAKAA